MPRRDGFPTNIEMLAELTGQGRDLFVETFQADLSMNPRPDLEGKQLGHIILAFSKVLQPGHPQDIAPGAVTSETLKMRLVTPYDAGIARDTHLGWKDHPEIADRMDFVGIMYGGLVVGDVVDISELGPEAVHTSYTANLNSYTRNGNQRTRFVVSSSDKPTKQTIASGLFLAREALGYVRSDGYRRFALEEIIEAVIKNGENPVPEVLTHDWELSYDWDIALNGHEDPEYLAEYQAHFCWRAQSTREHVGRLRALHAPREVVERAEQNLVRYESAIARSLGALMAQDDQEDI